MNRRRWAAVATGLAVVLAVTILANPYLPGQLLSPWVRETFSFHRAYASPDSMALVIEHGGSSSCPSEAVRHEVVQEPDRVVVTLTRQLLPGGRPCTTDYEIRPIQIPLTAPLGRRAVLDGSNQETIPVNPLPAGQPVG
jgi:hypothetical protein